MTYHIEYENYQCDVIEARNIEQATQIALERAHKMNTRVMRVH